MDTNLENQKNLIYMLWIENNKPGYFVLHRLVKEKYPDVKVSSRTLANWIKKYFIPRSEKAISPTQDRSVEGLAEKLLLQRLEKEDISSAQLTRIKAISEQSKNKRGDLDIPKKDIFKDLPYDKRIEFCVLMFYKLGQILAEQNLVFAQWWFENYLKSGASLVNNNRFMNPNETWLTDKEYEKLGDVYFDDIKILDGNEARDLEEYQNEVKVKSIKELLRDRDNLIKD